jgi:hypothetical protein
MKKQSRFAGGFAIFVCAIILLTILSCNAKSNNTIKIEINSWVVRDRVIPLETIEMRSTIIIGFRISPELENLSKYTIQGELFLNEVLIFTDKILHLDSLGNNLGFDIPLLQSEFRYDKPLSIPDGKYLIVIKLLDENQKLLAQGEKELDRDQIGRRFYGLDKVYERSTYLEIAGNTEDKNNGLKRKSPRSKQEEYFVFRRSYLQRIYPNTEPDSSEQIESISTEISKNEYKPITFSVYALKNLGKVEVSVSPLGGAHGTLGPDLFTIGTVRQLTEVVQKHSDKNVVFYRWAPKIIEPKEVTIPYGRSQRYWLTVRAGSEVIPGDYYGVIAIKPELAHPTEVPFHVRVLPFGLTDTDIQYGMMMTYAFYELDNDKWTGQEKDLIRNNGLQIYNDFRKHGLTMIYPHSYFYLKRDGEGQPILHSLRASLEAYKRLKFPGPFCWYLGHLLQTSKPSHPGSIVNYDPSVAKKRLRFLLKEYETTARLFNIPKEKLIVQLVDEPDRRDRVAAGKELNRIARQMGFKTLVTRTWPDVDIICTGTPKDAADAVKLRRLSKRWWIYPNSTLSTKNRAHSRYVFGFGAWNWGVDGVAPWTFQMSQGCNGNPFTILDGPERMAAYPGVNGPIATPTWEAIRDGINDYKYIYQLRRLISVAKEKGNPRASVIERQLRQFKHRLGKGPGAKENEFGDWPPESFEKRRKQIVDWALELIAVSK